MIKNFPLITFFINFDYLERQNFIFVFKTFLNLFQKYKNIKDLVIQEKIKKKLYFILVSCYLYYTNFYDNVLYSINS